MSKLAKKGIINLKPYKPGKPIEEVKRELLLEEVYKLASNENPIGPSPKAIAAVKKVLKDINRYPDGSCYYLREKLAEKLGVGPENLIFGNGSDEIMEIIVQTFMNQDEEAIIAEPTFLEYRLVVQASGAQIKTVPLVNFKYDLDGMKRAVSGKTKVIFIANPDNPTGSYLTDREITKFIDGLSENIIVVMDEAYYDFVDAKDYPDTIKYLKDRNVIILRTFSKAYGLAGLRIGYGLANAELIDCMNRVRQPFNVNMPAQVAALASLDDPQHLKKSVAAVFKGKKYLYRELDKMGLSYVPSQTNFILIDVRRAGREVFERLLRYGVIVRDMEPYKLDNYIRVTVGIQKENNKFIESLKKVMSNKI